MDESIWNAIYGTRGGDVVPHTWGVSTTQR